MSLHHEIMTQKIPFNHEFNEGLNAAAELALKADAEIERLQKLSDERFSQLRHMDKLVMNIQDERCVFLNHIKAVQSASDEAGLIGMIGSPAWIGQLKKLTDNK